MTDSTRHRNYLPGNGIILFLLLFFLAESASGQMSTNITHNMFTGMALNPAFAGSNDAICVTGLMRQQWIGLKDNTGSDVSPQTYIVSVDAPIRFLHGGVGGTIMQDKIGNYSNIYIKAGYAYQKDLGAGVLSAGIQIDVVSTKVKGDFNAVDQNDELITKMEKSDLTADMGIGLLYRVPDKYYIGFAADQLLESEQKKISLSLKRTYLLQGGYNFPFRKNPAFEIQPSALIRTDLAAFSFDASALLVYNKKFWGGLSYRYEDMMAILLGLSIKGVKVGVSYDLGLGSLANYQSGGLEIMVNYCFKIQTEKFRKSYRNTRFL